MILQAAHGQATLGGTEADKPRAAGAPGQADRILLLPRTLARRQPTLDCQAVGVDRRPRKDPLSFRG